MGLKIDKNNMLPLMLMLAPVLVEINMAINLAAVNPTVSIDWVLTAVGTIVYIVGFVLLAFKKKN